MPEPIPHELNDFSEGVNDTRDPALVGPKQLSDARNVFYKDGKLQTRKGYTEISTPQTTTQTATAGLCGNTTIGTVGWAIQDDEFNSAKVTIAGGTGSSPAQIRTVSATASDGGDGRLTISAAWDTNPDGTSTYYVYDLPIKSLYKYTQDNGVELLICHTGGRFFKSTDAASWVEIAVTDNDSADILFTITAQASYTTFQGKMYCSNGAENVWSLDASGNTFVYDRDGTGTATKTGTQTRLYDSNRSEADDYFDNFKIYFLSDDTQNFDISKTVTDYQEDGVDTRFDWVGNLPVATTTTDTYYVGPDIPKGNFLVSCQNRLFAIDRSTSKMYYSGINDPWCWPDENYVYIELAEGERCTGGGVFDGYLVVMKERSLVRYDVSDPYPMNWRHKLINTHLGCAYHNSIQTLPIRGVDHLVWISYQGLCVVGPDWQVHNVSKKKLENLFDDLQMPTYTYLMQTWTTQSDFETGTTEDPALSIDTTTLVDSFMPQATTKIYTSNADWNTGGTHDGTKSIDGALRIDFTKGVKEENSTFAGAETWVEIERSITRDNKVQTFSHTGGLFLWRVSVFVKRDSGAGDGLEVSVFKGNIAIAYGTIAHADIPTASGGWVDCTFTTNKLIFNDVEHRLALNRKLDTGTYFWKHEDPGSYPNGKSDQTATGDYGFKISGANASGIWTGNEVDTGFTEDMTYGEFDASIGGYEGATFEMSFRKSGGSWSSWGEVWRGKKIDHPVINNYLWKLKITLTTPDIDISPLIHDASVPYCPHVATLISAEYHQTGSFTEWGNLDVIQTPESAQQPYATTGIRWYVKTDSVTGLAGGTWVELRPGDAIPSPAAHSFMKWKCVLVTYNPSNVVDSNKPRVEEVRVGWIDWTAGGALTSIGSSVVWDEKYYFACAKQSSSSNDLVLVLDENGALWPWSIAMNSLVIFRQELFGGDNSGQIHKMDIGYSDNESAYTDGVYAVLKEIGIPDRVQLWRAAYVAVDAMAGDYNLTVETAIDAPYGQTGPAYSPDYTTLGTINLMGTGKKTEMFHFDSTNNLQGNFLRVKLSTTSANEPWSLYSVKILSFIYPYRGKPNAPAIQVAI